MIFFCSMSVIIQLENVMHEAEKCCDDLYLFQYLEIITSVLEC